MIIPVPQTIAFLAMPSNDKSRLISLKKTLPAVMENSIA